MRTHIFNIFTILQCSDSTHVTCSLSFLGFTLPMQASSSCAGECMCCARLAAPMHPCGGPLLHGTAWGRMGPHCLCYPCKRWVGCATGRTSMNYHAFNIQEGYQQLGIAASHMCCPSPFLPVTLASFVELQTAVHIFAPLLVQHVWRWVVKLVGVHGLQFSRPPQL